jgi:3-dehydroquinate synthase II
MKQFWVDVRPWKKEIATTAIESGADALVVDKTENVKRLGRITTIAPDGDMKIGTDVAEVTITDKESENAAAKITDKKFVIVTTSDWTVIPLENLVAQRGGLMVEVRHAEDARTVTQILEKGVDGIVLVTDDPSEIKRAANAVHGYAEAVPLVRAKITRVKALGMGDRVCLDTCTNMQPGEGMLIGNTSSAFFLVHSESIETPYVATRPFRVNAGAVHAYVLGPEGRTRYLSELASGDPVLLVRFDGATQVAYLGRSKIERRPMLLVEAEADGQPISLVLQNAETIRLTRPDGSALSVATLQPGDEVLAHVTTGGRHFGMKVQETLTER